MRNWTRSILLSLLLASLCFAPPSKPIRGMQGSRTHPLARGLVGCWLMNEGTGGKVHDLSGNGLSGIATSCTWSPGKHGAAIEFNGSSSLVNFGTMGNIGSTLSTASTMSLWLKSPVSDLFGYLLGVYDSDGSCCFVKLNADSDNNLAAGNIRVLLDNSGDALYRLSGSVNRNTGVTDGNWHYLCVVFNRPGKELQVWVDGIKQEFTYKHQDAIGSLADFGIDFYMGGINVDGTTPMYFNGLISTFSIHNRLLTPAEIAGLYADPFQMFEEPARQLYAAGGAAAEPERPQIILIGSVTPLTILTASLAFASCKRKAA